MAIFYNKALYNNVTIRLVYKVRLKIKTKTINFGNIERVLERFPASLTFFTEISLLNERIKKHNAAKKKIYLIFRKTYQIRFNQTDCRMLCVINSQEDFKVTEPYKNLSPFETTHRS